MKEFLLYLCYPLTGLYGWVMAVRNSLYNLGVLRSKHHSTLVIAVGNLNFGGSGKTPHVSYLANLLAPFFRVAILSRGYGRKTSGFYEVNNKSSVFEVGDEPLMYAMRHAITIAVDENRNHGIEKLKQKYPDLDVILLDDAFQHRAVAADLSILISDYALPFYKDKVFPFGRLREYSKGYRRADIIIFSKSPIYIHPLDKRSVLDSVREASYQDVFFSSLIYEDPRAVLENSKTEKIENLGEILLVTGIANPNPLLGYLEEKSISFQHLPFGDHHFFGTNDIATIAEHYTQIPAQKKAILTTEKDAMRLKHIEAFADIPLYYIPISIAIHPTNQQDKDLNKKILKYVRENKTNSKFNKNASCF